MSKFHQTVQNMAGNDFPAQELWARGETQFRAYKVTEVSPNKYTLSETSGEYKYGDIKFETYPTVQFETDNIEQYIDRLCLSYEKDDFKCFASLM